MEPDLQSEFKDSAGPNGREDSWGVAQINLKWNPDITRAEAQDPLFALPWAAKQWVAGNAHHWTEWRVLEQKYGDGTWPES